MLSDSLPDLRALELLEAVDRTSSLTLAAAELGVTQQAVSLRLRRLEERLGRSLVLRSSRSSHLTPVGEELMALARPVLEAARAMDRDVTAWLAADTRLELAASLTIAEYFLPTWISAFVKAGHDSQHLRSRATNTREVIRLVSDEEVQLGFVEGAAPPPGLRYRFLADDELSVYVSPDHPWAASRRISAWTLAKTPLVTREEGSGCRAVVARALTEHGVDRSLLVQPALELASNTAVLESAAANVAPAVISTCTAVGYLEKRRLVRVRVDRVSFRRQLGAIWKQGSQPPSFAARAFLETARSIEKAPAAQLH